MYKQAIEFSHHYAEEFNLDCDATLVTEFAHAVCKLPLRFRDWEARELYRGWHYLNTAMQTQSDHEIDDAFSSAVKFIDANVLSPVEVVAAFKQHNATIKHQAAATVLEFEYRICQVSISEYVKAKQTLNWNTTKGHESMREVIYS
jgi:hypothetical protein